jgi:hypothetical protein
MSTANKQTQQPVAARSQTASDLINSDLEMLKKQLDEDGKAMRIDLEKQDYKKRVDSYNYHSLTMCH